jgi:Ca2+-transporting ATPase
MRKGLTQTEAERIREKSGFNELPSSKPKGIGRIAMEVMKEPMFLLLIACAGLYLVLGKPGEGLVLLPSVFIIILITFFQYRKTEKALEALKSLSSPRALVLRDGKEIRIPGREVVPGDLLILHEGDRIAADGNILESVNLTVDESILTGESLPVSKPMESDPKPTVFSGTLVIQGTGFAEVTATGIETEFGKIGKSLQSIEPDETRLHKELKRLIRNLFIIGGIISVGIVAAYYFTRGNFIQSLLNGLAATMAILPEEFPVVMTVFLAMGAWRLSKNNVLTRKPSAIETLGSATVLCSDKTGTITQNKMEVAAYYNGTDVFYKDLFSENHPEIVPIATAASRASSTDSHDPMEKAIRISHKDLDKKEGEEHKLVREYPLSKDLLAMTRVLEEPEGNDVSISTKGAPEAIFALCKMSPEEAEKHLNAVKELAGKGYRVLGVARGENEDKNLPEMQKDFHFHFLGLIALEDPIRPEVPQAVKECLEAGIKVIVITGDYPATAKNIGMQIGLPEGDVLTGDDIERLSEEELQKKIRHTHIFARVIPEQKLRIVRALKANNEVVAMTGDGVNDAPALKAADIGVSMGMKGTDVAREASSLVLLDDNFASIVSAIRSGRRIFDNLQKAMAYIFAIHIPIIGLSLLPAFFAGWPLVYLPIHIVFMELIIDPVCSIAFEYQKEEKGIMTRKPRKPGEKFFSGKKIVFSILQGFLLLATVLVVYFISIREGLDETEVRTIAFSTLILGNVFLILTDLSKTRSVFWLFKERNGVAFLVLGVSVMLLALILWIPVLRSAFKFTIPVFLHFLPALIGPILLLLVLEGLKFLKIYFLNKEVQRI